MSQSRSNARLSLGRKARSNCTAVLAAAMAAGAVLLAPTNFLPTTYAADPLSPDDQAALLLNAARRTYNDHNYPQAVNQFREYTQKFGGGKEIAAAWYGLGLSLLDGARDYPAAADALAKAAGVPGWPDRPLALYFTGVAVRGQGQAEARLALEKPPEADQHNNAARQKFAEAANQFALAATALVEQEKTAPAEAKLSAAEWTARARCDQAEMLSRSDRAKEAIAAAQPILADAALAKSKYRLLALYETGNAQFALKDYMAAGRALSQLAPFDQEFGPHARFLLARVHHLAGERPEAAAQYAAIVTGFDQYKKNAAQQIQQGGNDVAADRKAFLESIANGPAPDYVQRAAFYQAVLLSDQGRYPEAKDLLTKFIADAKTSPLLNEARLRVGFCQLQSKQFPEAIASLTPLKDDAKLGDQAQWWLCRAQMGTADQNNPQAVENAAKAVIDPYRRALDKNGQLAQADADAKLRRPDLLLDLADAQMQAKLYRDAANTYQEVVSENAVPERTEEAAQRQISALQYAEDYPRSDEFAANFEQKFPNSTLLPAVLFRTAENAYLVAAAAAAKPDTGADEIDRLFNVAALRYHRLIARAPEFQYINLAKQSMALSYYKLGKYPQALEALTQIPDAERTGDLAATSYIQADCLIRTFPPETDDALSAAGLIQTSEQAAKLLETFIGGNAKSPLIPDAMLKYGYCYQRMAGLLADKPEHDKALQVARETYDKHLSQFANDKTAAAVYLERAKTIAMQGDVGAAINELRRFLSDPLRNAPNAPLAAMRLSSLMRSQGQAKEAAEMIAKVRAEQEPALSKDRSRIDWIPMLMYETALAVKESGNLKDANTLFDGIFWRFNDKPDAVNAAWRSVQCLREGYTQEIVAFKAKLNQPGIKPGDAMHLADLISDKGGAIGNITSHLEMYATKLPAEKTTAEPLQRVLYELAWCDRTTGEAEFIQARQRARVAALEKFVAKQRKDGVTPSETLQPPDIDDATIPLQPSEKRARERYQRIVSVASDQPLAVRARFELAELIADRGDYDGALDLLNAALLTGPPQEIAERVRLRMAACFLAKSDAKSAVQAVKPLVTLVARPDQPQRARVAAEARFVQGEAAIQQLDWKQAIELLIPFRDQEPLKNVEGVSDRALLRLGEAYARSNQWAPSQQAFEALMQRFPQSMWIEEARFGVGLAMQNQNRLDDAIAAFTEVTHRTAGEVAARSLLQVGSARVAQKKLDDAVTAFTAVAYTYDYPEWSAAACLEAAGVLKELKKPEQAAKLLKRVVDDYPNTKSAPLAKAKLAELK